MNHPRFITLTHQGYHCIATPMRDFYRKIFHGAGVGYCAMEDQLIGPFVEHRRAIECWRKMLRLALSATRR